MNNQTNEGAPAPLDYASNKLPPEGGPGNAGPGFLEIKRRIFTAPTMDDVDAWISAGSSLNDGLQLKLKDVAHRRKAALRRKILGKWDDVPGGRST